MQNRWLFRAAFFAQALASCGPDGGGCPDWPELIMVDVNGSREVFVPSWDPCKELSPGRCMGPDGVLTYTATVTKAAVGWTLQASCTGGGGSESIDTTLVDY